MGVARVWLVCRLFAYTKILNIRESAVAAYRIKSSQQNHAVEYTCIESDTIASLQAYAGWSC